MVFFGKQLQKKAPNEYYAASEMNLASSQDFVPRILQNVLLWLLSKEVFESAYPEFIPADKLLRKVLTITECITYNSNKKPITPLHLGLAAQLHHAVH